MTRLNSWVIYRLEENYEITEAVCIPRNTLYCHYLDYCETNDTQPVNAASFGKVGRGMGNRTDHFFKFLFKLFQGFIDMYFGLVDLKWSLLGEFWKSFKALKNPVHVFRLGRMIGACCAWRDSEVNVITDRLLVSDGPILEIYWCSMGLFRSIFLF